MKTKQTVDNNLAEWQANQIQIKQKKQQKPDQKEKEMIRELQAIFCKGRYHSWMY